MLLSVALIYSLCCSAFDALAQPPLRTQLVLYPYHGVGGVQPDAMSADLELYLSDKVRTLYAGFAREPAASHLSSLQVVKATSKPATPAELAADWTRRNALLLLDGVLVSSGGKMTARSSIYFGAPPSGASRYPPELVHLDLPLDADEFGSVIDTHSVATLYALALDAKRSGLPKNLYLHIAARALEIIDTLNSRPTHGDLQELKCGLQSLISEATGVATTGQC